jgi:hypothetical protein
MLSVASSGLKFANEGAQFVLVHKAHESVHNLTWKIKNKKFNYSITI